MVVLVDAAKSAKEKLKTAALATKAAVALAVAASADAGPISDAERSRMNTLRDMLQAKIQEQVMIVKLGEVVTIEQAEAQLEQLVRLRQMEDLVTYLRFVGKPMHEEDEMNVDVLVGRVVKALDWQPLKEALGINEHGGKARRRVRPLAPPFPRCLRHSLRLAVALLRLTLSVLTLFLLFSTAILGGSSARAPLFFCPLSFPPVLPCAHSQRTFCRCRYSTGSCHKRRTTKNPYVSDSPPRPA